MLTTIAALMTVGVCGLVAGIVKLDDLGLHLTRSARAVLRSIGRGILIAAPKFMKALAIAGTVAMFLVGGSILLHGLPFLQHAVEAATAGMAGAAAMLVSLLADALTGVIAGGLVVGTLAVISRIRGTGGGVAAGG